MTASSCFATDFMEPLNVDQRNRVEESLYILVHAWKLNHRIIVDQVVCSSVEKYALFGCNLEVAKDLMLVWSTALDPKRGAVRQ